MAKTITDRLRESVDLFADALGPWMQLQLESQFEGQWAEKAQSFLLGKDAENFNVKQMRDPSILFSMFIGGFQECFGRVAPPLVRGNIHEIKEARNRYSHRETITTDYATRAIDRMVQVCETLGLDAQKQLRETYDHILRERIESRAKNKRQQAEQLLKVGAASDIKPWREVIEPHPDVQRGTFEQAEFAADLGQVHNGEGADEYRDPIEFYRRTYLTVGIKHLLKNAITRLAGKGGDPVMELKTNFGGGKSHSMIALWHAVGGTDASQLPGMSELLEEWGIESLPTARRVVLHGVAMQPGKATTKPDGTRINTMWGEMAWQLGGADAFEMVRELDENGTYPGSELLHDMFKRYGPALILIDEWIRYIGPTYTSSNLPAGSFESQFSFAQSLTEAARRADNVMLVASIPQSEVELGGDAGEDALKRLLNVFGRMEQAWRPASADEGFEIVIRRLFQPMTQAAQRDARDVTAGAFRRMYEEYSKEFPSDCSSLEYARRISGTYPIHPELFDRLFKDWAQLESFQRTRGVLRLMANVIHELWDEGDQSRLIMPGSVPIHDDRVQHELTRYLDHGWQSVIASDIDSDNAASRVIDRDNPGFQKVSAARRVARTIYIGSAPLGEERGITEQQVRLGSVQPGESPATFSDALRRLAEQGTHIYREDGRYWLSPRANMTRAAKDYAAAANELDVRKEIVDRLKTSAESRPGREYFKGVYVAPDDPGSIPDEGEARLVVLGPEFPHRRGRPSAARERAAELLQQRSTGGHRTYQNALLFLAPDEQLLKDLEGTARRLIGWQQVLAKRGDQLAGAQERQATQQLESAKGTLEQQVLDTWNHLLAPHKSDPQGDLSWDDESAKGNEPIVEKAGRAATKAGALALEYSPKLLRMQLDSYLWNQDGINHRDVKQLWEWFASYLYLPRLRDQQVLAGAITAATGDMDGVRSFFGYAAAWNEEDERYEGLVEPGQGFAQVFFDGQSVLVKSDVALAQLEAERIAISTDNSDGGVEISPAETGGGTASLTESETKKVTLTDTESPLPTHYFGAVDVAPDRFIKDGQAVFSQVIAHLVKLDPKVKVSIEIESNVPGGIPRDVMRVVAENANVLKFSSSEFEIR